MVLLQRIGQPIAKKWVGPEMVPWILVVECTAWLIEDSPRSARVDGVSDGSASFAAIDNPFDAPPHTNLKGEVSGPGLNL